MPPKNAMSTLRNFDWFRKVPRDLSEATLPGSIISLTAMVVMVVLFFLVRSARVQRCLAGFALLASLCAASAQPAMRARRRA